jgi:ribosomal protein L17
VQLVEKLTAIAKKDTSNADRKIMKSVLHNFFP